MWSSTKLMVVVVFMNICALLILSTSPATAQSASTGDCSRVVKKKLFCQNYLKNHPTTTTTHAAAISGRTRSCCDTLRKINNARDDSEVVKCLKQSSRPLGSKTARLQLPGICKNLPGHKSHHVNLIAPETDETESHELQWSALRPRCLRIRPCGEPTPPAAVKPAPTTPGHHKPGHQKPGHQKPPLTPGHHHGHHKPPMAPGLLPPPLLPVPLPFVHPPPLPILPLPSSSTPSGLPESPPTPAHPPAAETEAELVEEIIYGN